MAALKVGIDVGGSKIYTIVRDPEGNVLARCKTRTDREGGITSVAHQMKETATIALHKCGHGWEDVAGVGAAIPSSFDHTRGMVLRAVNLGWFNEPAAEIFSDVFGQTVALGNDVNCGTLAEYCFGAATNSTTTVGFFVGTGLGGGLIINGQLYTGKAGTAGELGHMVVKKGGRQCGCGNHGCLEAYCSKTAFSKRFHKKINVNGEESLLTRLIGNDFSRLKSRTIAKAYFQGDKVVRDVLHKGAYYLGIGCANMCQIIAPDCFVFGGGVIEELGPELLPHIREGLNDHIVGLQGEKVRLELSMLGDDAVAVGATILTEMSLS